jgi:hypothetical protein
MNSAKQQHHHELKRKIVLENLLKLGVYTSQDGKSVYDLSYDDLKYELVLASFREIDRQNDEGKWF